MQSETDTFVVAFAGGGTGGHLYPALAVADALRRRCGSVRCIFFGTGRSVDAHVLGDADVVRQNLKPLSPLPWRWPGVYASIRRAIGVSTRRFETDPPSIVIGTGGMASVPAVLAARRLGIATAILNPDAIPGRANRYLAGRVDAVFCQWEESAKYLPRRVAPHACGCPVRPQFLRATRDDGIARFNLDRNRLTLLITGASQGARTINEAVLASAGFLKGIPEWQILHLTGDQEFDRVSTAYQACGLAATVVAYTDHMGDALAASDLVVSRAGASTLAELTAVGRPSILMPYPYHRDQHQMANARCLERASAAQIVPDRKDAKHNGPALVRALQPLMTHDSEREAMAVAARALGRSNAAMAIAERILRLAGRGGCAVPRESLETVTERTR